MREARGARHRARSHLQELHVFECVRRHIEILEIFALLMKLVPSQYACIPFIRCLGFLVLSRTWRLIQRRKLAAKPPPVPVEFLASELQFVDRLRAATSDGPISGIVKVFFASWPTN